MTEPLNYRQRRGHGGARKGAGRSSLVSDRDLIAIGARIRAKADELQIEAGKKLLWERLEEKHEEYFEVIAWLKDKPDRREIRAYGAMLILQKEMATVKADHRLGIRSDDYKRLEAECDNLRYLYPQGFDKAFDMVGRFDEVLMGKATRHFHEIETNLHEIPRPQGQHWLALRSGTDGRYRHRSASRSPAHDPADPGPVPGRSHPASW